MLRRSASRLSTALVVVLSLLFSQLALASYVCPGQQDAKAMLAMVESGSPCDGMDQDQPVLCHQYSADPAKTFEAAKLPIVAVAIVQVLLLPVVLDADASLTVSVSAPAEARPPPAPLFLSTLRLRV